MSKIRLIQTFIICAVVLLLAFLYTRDVKGLVEPKEDPAAVQARQPIESENEIKLDEVSMGAKNMIATNLAKEISAIEYSYKNASGQEKTDLAAKLAKKWDSLDQLVPSALYYEIVAKQDGSLTNWLKSGNQFMRAFDNNADTLLQAAILQRANASFTKALQLDSASLDAKAGLGTTIVNGMGAPMQGIEMLLDVVKRDPKNFNANMQLGMFAMKSGQFGKAVDRFKHVLTLKRTSEAYFWLGTAYENLDQKEEAVNAYLTSKEIAANPMFSDFIDKKVAELKK